METTVKYKNIVFDFGNVVGKFDERHILMQFCSSEEDYEDLLPVLFSSGWLGLDEGTIDYEQYAKDCEAQLPEHLRENCRAFFRSWGECVDLFPQTLAFIQELKARGAQIYLLSNASTYFADYALKNYEVLKEFDGTVFSAPLKICKPDPAIYQYLFSTYSLRPEECFFIDDLDENIEVGKKLRMDGIVFTGDIDAVKQAIEF